MSLININQTSFDHTFQSNVTFLSSSFFQSNVIVASGTKLEVNGTSTFIGASSFSGAATFKDTVSVDSTLSVNSSITGESLEISSSSTLNNININGKLYDGDGDFGTAGQLLSSDGTDLNWIDASSTSVANANNVGTNANSTNTDQFITFVGASSGNNPIRVDTNLKYNPSTNVLTAPSFSGDLTGTIQTAAQTNITSLGTLSSLAVSGNITQSGTNNYIRINGGLQDKDGADGTSGQVLSSTGTQVNWINVGDITAGSASEVGVTAVNTNAVHFITFVDSSSGNENIRVDTNLAYNPSTNIISSKISDISNHDTGDLSEGTNLYYTNARADARIAAADTGDLSEGTNLYHTTARARSSISAGGDLSYNSSTGVMSISVPSAFVSGMIILWSGSIGSIPSGFVLCNGSNSTPDLRDRFVVGAGSGYSVGATGGATSNTLSTSQLPSHTHDDGSLTTANYTHTHDTKLDANRVFGFTQSGDATDGQTSPYGNPGSLPGWNIPTNLNASDQHNHNISGNTGATGGGSSIENRPPYYALCYIMKT